VVRRTLETTLNETAFVTSIHCTTIGEIEGA
jgi:hypothetical protein